MKINRKIIVLSALFSLVTLTPLGINNNFNNNEIIKKENYATNIQISNKDELLKFVNEATSDGYSLGKTFELTSDIDLNGITINPIAIFAGSFLGNNFKISNFKIDASKSGKDCGFFRSLTKDALIKDLTLDYEIESQNDETVVGGICGTNYGTIDHCNFNGYVKGVYNVGGIAGKNEDGASILNSTNNGNINGIIFVGGVAGYNKGTIKNSFNHGIINDMKASSNKEITISNIGGITGFNQFIIKNCENFGEIGRKQIGNFIGGISGSSIGKIYLSQNHGSIKGNGHVGGIIGYFAEFLNKNSDQSLNDLNDIIDKIVNGKGSKEDNNNSGISELKSLIPSLKSSYNNGTIIGNSSVGGIVGYVSNDSLKLNEKNFFDIKNCVNEGYVEGAKEAVGGISGTQVHGNILECFNIGNIDGSAANYVGGIAGKSNGNIAYTYSINDMKGVNYIGGITGSGNKVHDNYSIVTINASGQFVGAIAGSINEINQNVYDNYYVNENYYGVDNIDYQNKITRLDKENLASEGLTSIKLNKDYWTTNKEEKSYPILKSFLELDESVELNKLLKEKAIQSTKFGSYVNFINEDKEIIKKIFVPFGENLDPNLVPDVPKKEGKFSRWEDFDLNNIKENLYINVIYEEIITTLASHEGNKPTVLVTGEFYSTSKINLKCFEEINLNIDKKYTYIESYIIKVIDETNEIDVSNLKAKIYLKNNYHDPHILVKDNDEYKLINSKIDGTYITFDINGENNFILVDEEFQNIHNPYFIVTITFSILGSLLIIGLVTFFIIKHYKKKQKITSEK